MDAKITVGSVVIPLDKEVGRGAEVWITGYEPGLLEGDAYDLAPDKTIVLVNGDTIARVGEAVVVWVSPAIKRRAEETAQAA